VKIGGWQSAWVGGSQSWGGKKGRFGGGGKGKKNRRKRHAKKTVNEMNSLWKETKEEDGVGEG